MGKISQKSKSQESIIDVQQEVLKKRTGLLAVVDRLGGFLTNPVLFISLLIFHLIWMVLLVRKG
jgi:uncharacterized membrane protein